MERKDRIHAIVDRKRDTIGQMNQAVYSYAEYGYHEFKSSAKLEEVLEQEGFEVERGACGIETAFIGTYGSGRPVIGILAEYDALPNLSQKAGVAEHCPIEGQQYGHGCGHSALGAGGVGAALVVKEYLKETGASGTVKIYGCPAEETGFGKSFMAKRGAFDHLDLCYAWHPQDRVESYTRAVAYYKIRFDFKGITAHAGGAPELGRSALDACELMNVGVNYLREHIISSARVHYAYLDAGGEAPNVVQDHASLLYFVRAPRLSDCDSILARIRKIAQGAALMTETEVKITLLGGLNDYVPNPTGCRLLTDAAQEIGPIPFSEEEYAIARKFLDIMPDDKRAQAIQQGASINGVSEEEFAERPLISHTIPYSEKYRERIMTSSTDVGDVSYKVPTGQFTATTAIPGTGIHTWQFAAQTGSPIGDRTSAYVAETIANACAMVYEDPSLAEQAWKELVDETGGNYTCPVPDGIEPLDVV